MKKNFLIFFLITINLNAQQIKISKPKEIKFSNPFSLVIELEKNYNIVSFSTTVFKDSDFEILNYTIKQNKIELKLIPFNVGISTIPSLTINLSNLTETKTPPLPLEIKPLYNPKETDQIRDIAPIIKFLWWLNLLMLILLSVIIYLIYKKILKNKQKNNIQINLQDTRTPYQRAKDKLKELTSKRLLEEDKIKEYYIELSDIVRVFIEEEFKIPATQMTSNEIIKKLKNDFKIEIIIALREFLEISDLVKFAKYIPQIERINKNTKDAENIIEMLNNFSIEQKIKEEEKLKKELNKNEI